MTDATRCLPFLLAVGLALGLATLAPAAEASPVNTMCPVLTDEAVDPSITIEYEGRTIGFCCMRCRREFLEDPGAFAANLPAAGNSAGPQERGGGEGHDHAGDQDHGEPGLDRAVRFAGKFHPMLVHFPIALAISAALAELLLLLTGRPGFAPAARFATFVAALGAVVAAPLGWAAAAHANGAGALAENLELHRWTGTAAGILLVLVGLLSELERRGSSRRLRLAYRVLLFAAVPLIGIVGHLGATLVFGPSPLAW